MSDRAGAHPCANLLQLASSRFSPRPATAEVAGRGRVRLRLRFRLKEENATKSWPLYNRLRVPSETRKQIADFNYPHQQNCRSRQPGD